MLYNGLYIAGTNNPDAGIWNMASGAGYTLQTFSVMGDGVAASKFD